MSYFLKENLKALREEYKLSQEQLALELNLTKAKYANYERGTEPDASTLVIICDYYKISLRDLVTLDLRVTENMNKVNGFAEAIDEEHSEIHYEIKKEDYLKTIKELTEIIQRLSKKIK